MSDTVLLTGATGFLGQHLLRELIAAGHPVRALSRSVEADALLSSQGAMPMRGDMLDADSLQAATRGVRFVVHTAADTGQWRGNNARQTAINLGGTRALLQASQAAGVQGFLHTSSVSAYSHLCHETLREDLPQRGGESWVNYERSKHLSERAVRESGLDFMIFQPAHVFGPGDVNNWSRLIRLIDQEALPGAPPGGGAFADVREIAKAQVRALQAPRWGEAYLLGGEHIDFLPLIQRIGAKLGRKTPRRALPAWVLMAYAQVLGLGARISGKVPEITPESAAITSHRLQVDSGKAQREWAYQLTPIDTLLDDTIAWMRAQRMLAPTVPG